MRLGLIASLLAFCQIFRRCAGRNVNVKAFYQLFAGDEGSRDLVVEVATEQMASFLASDIGKAASSVVVTVVGGDWKWARDNLHWNDEKVFVSQETSGPEGWEDLSLDLLWAHCREFQDKSGGKNDTASATDAVADDTLVVYFHSKGTFHLNEENTVLRRASMDAIQAPCCLELLSATPPLHNVCGLRLCPEPHFHYPGNFFVARCDYVSKLHPPTQSIALMDEVAAVAYSRPWRGVKKLDPAYFGLERYAHEHWIGSHDALRAADALPGSDRESFWCASWGPGTKRFERGAEPLQCTSAPRRGVGIIPFAGEIFPVDVLPEQRLVEFLVLHGGVSEENEEDGECYRSHCAYYSRGVTLVSKYGNDTFPNAAAWRHSAESFLLPALNCSPMCLEMVENSTMSPIEPNSGYGMDFGTGRSRSVLYLSSKGSEQAYYHNINFHESVHDAASFVWRSLKDPLDLHPGAFDLIVEHIHNGHGYFPHLTKPEPDVRFYGSSGVIFPPSIRLLERLASGQPNFRTYLQIGECLWVEHNMAYRAGSLRSSQHSCVGFSEIRTHFSPGGEGDRFPALDLVYVEMGGRGGLRGEKEMVEIVSLLLGRLASYPGALVISGCNPAIVAMTSATWYGSCWGIMSVLRSRADLDVAVGDFDRGCAVILKRDNSDPLSPADLRDPVVSWHEFDSARERILRLKTLPELERWYLSPGS